MLQQTTVATVHGFYARFIARFPRIEDLAAAKQGDVLTAWAGLGYYSRARNLHLCAQQIVACGHFPENVASLVKLPGIGPYTARAIAAIAFNVPVVPVDGNVERVTARLFAVKTPLPTAKKQLAALADGLNVETSAIARASDFAQALFDLGATVCTPRQPKCDKCPWRAYCTAFTQGEVTRYPKKVPKVKRSIFTGASWIIRGPEDRVWLRQRPQKGLLAGMFELPGTEWRPSSTNVPTPPPRILTNEWAHCGQIKHVFTHLTLYLDLYLIVISSWDFMRQPEFIELLNREEDTTGFACATHELHKYALPSLTQKSLARVRLVK